MRRLEIRTLKDHRVPQAFPLMQLVVPELSLEDWTRYAESQMAPPEMVNAGILAAIDQRDYILGLLNYRVDRELEHGTTLMVRHLIAVDFFGTNRREVATALITAMDRLADDLGCLAIRTTISGPDFSPNYSWIMELLENHGHEPACVNLCKALVPAF